MLWSIDSESDTVSRIIARQWHRWRLARNDSGPWTRTGTPTTTAGMSTLTRWRIRTSGTSVTRWFPETLKFSPAYGREFLFNIPFFHPPSSVPIFSRLSRKTEYSLVVINLFSQAISEKNLVLSIFNIACSRKRILFEREAYLL